MAQQRSVRACAVSGMQWRSYAALENPLSGYPVRLMRLHGVLMALLVTPGARYVRYAGYRYAGSRLYRL